MRWGTGFNPVYARSGHVLFARDSTLFTVRFDAATLRTEGAPVPVLDDMATLPSNGTAGVAISDNGTLAVRHFAVVDRHLGRPGRTRWSGRTGDPVIGGVSAPAAQTEIVRHYAEWPNSVVAYRLANYREAR